MAAPLTLVQACLAPPLLPEDPPRGGTPNPRHAAMEANRAAFVTYARDLVEDVTEPLTVTLSRGPRGEVAEAWAAVRAEVVRILSKRRGSRVPLESVRERVDRISLGDFVEGMRSWDRASLPLWPPRGEWGDFACGLLGVDPKAVAVWPSEAVRGQTPVPLSRGPTEAEVVAWIEGLRRWGASVRGVAEAGRGYDLRMGQLASLRNVIRAPIPRHLLEEALRGAVRGARPAPPLGSGPSAMGRLDARDAVFEEARAYILEGMLGREDARAERLWRLIDVTSIFLHAMRDAAGLTDRDTMWDQLVGALPPEVRFTEAQLADGEAVVAARVAAMGRRPEAPAEPELPRAFVDAHLPSPLKDRQAARALTLGEARCRVRRAVLGLPDEAPPHPMRC